MLERRSIHNVDWLLAFSVLALASIGVGMVYSATSEGPLSGLAARQAAYLLAGFAVMVLVMAIDYHTLAELSYVFYAATLLALVYLLFFGRAIANTRGWVELGPVNFQPAEAAKVTTLLALSVFMSRRRTAGLGFTNMVSILGIVGIPVLLIARQPDLGTALTFLPLVAVAAFLGGIRVRTILILALIPILALPLIWNHYLQGRQKVLVVTFLDPTSDPRGVGYQVIQSKIAVGSGGLTGKGFLEGTQGQLKFLPAQHTDFIFSVIGEETGFLGVFVVMGLYFFMLARMFLSVGLARDRAGVYIVFTASMLIAFQFLVNIMMIIGLFPVVGITLPFLSYGGSSLLTNFIAVGLVLNVRMRRFANV